MIDVRGIQLALNAYRAPAPALLVDGVPGKNTRLAIRSVLASVGSRVPDGWRNWSDDRQQVAIEQLIYRDHGIEVGVIDGLVGEQTRWARTVWDARGLDKTVKAEIETFRDGTATGVAPTGASRAAARARWPRQRDVQQFYGPPGTGFVTMTLPFAMRIAWEPSQKITKVTVHGKCREAFERIWKRTLDTYGLDVVRELRLDMFGGCANVRRMRGGSAWSMHAFACAWDVDPDRNQLSWNRKSATLDDPPYEPFWDIVYDEGGLSLGRERDFDHQHFQFTRDLS